MKKRIGWLNNKPIIQGDKNLKNSNELHIDELTSSNSDGESGNEGGFTYKSRKVVWKIDVSEENKAIFRDIALLPFYSVCYTYEDSMAILRSEKYTKMASSIGIMELLNINYIHDVYIEEADSLFEISSPGLDNYLFNGSLIDYFIFAYSVTDSTILTEEEVIEMFKSIGIIQIPYDDYVNMTVYKEYDVSFK